MFIYTMEDHKGGFVWFGSDSMAEVERIRDTYQKAGWHVVRLIDSPSFELPAYNEGTWKAGQNTGMKPGN